MQPLLLNALSVAIAGSAFLLGFHIEGRIQHRQPRCTTGPARTNTHQPPPRLARQTHQRIKWEGPRAVTVSSEDTDSSRLLLVSVPDPPALARLRDALQEDIRLDTGHTEENGPHPGRLIDFLESRHFAIPCAYPAHWPFEPPLGE